MTHQLNRVFDRGICQIFFFLHDVYVGNGYVGNVYAGNVYVGIVYVGNGYFIFATTILKQKKINRNVVIGIMITNILLHAHLNKA